MPAHITALYPFLSQRAADRLAIARLSKLCESLPALRVEFRRTRRFPDVLDPDPEPADGLRRLTTTIFEEWPQAPPFRGEFDDVIPHLTIVNGEDGEILEWDRKSPRTCHSKRNSRKPGCSSLTERDGSGAHVSASVARRGKHRFGREGGSLAPGTAIAIGTGP